MTSFLNDFVSFIAGLGHGNCLFILRNLRSFCRMKKSKAINRFLEGDGINLRIEKTQLCTT